MMRVTVVRDEELAPRWASVAKRARLTSLLRGCGKELGVDDRSLVVRLTGDDVLQDLNRAFLGQPDATDVLAFPTDDVGHLGDVAISIERAAAQNVDAVAEVRLLAVHGLLHCLGHDHDEADGAATMTALTRRLLPDQTVDELIPHHARQGS